MNKVKSFISLMDCSEQDINELLLLANQFKSNQLKSDILASKNIGLYFTVPSTRTRISFQVACRRLGGNVDTYNASELQVENGESLIDTSVVMGKYLDGIIVRTYNMNNYGAGREALNMMATYSQIPVINALDDKDHPCQVLADLITLKEKFGDTYKKKKLVFSWGYTHRSKSLGVPHSMLSAAAILGMNIKFVYPKNFDLDPEYMSFAKKTAKLSGANIELSNNLDDAVVDADCLYVKNWKSLTLSKEDEVSYKETLKKEWCISSKHFESMKNKNAFYMDCMPLIRGEHVTAEVADSERSIMYQQAENRLYAQMAVLYKLIR